MILLDLERTIKTGRACYWKANKSGYTNEITEAGIYSHDKAVDIVRSDLDLLTVPLPEETVLKLLND
jgi:hypothetical protein